MTNKTIIAPSILSCDFLNIETDLANLKGSEDLWLHLDIMDGHFVPNLTFGAPIVKMIADRFDFILDAHLMVSNPDFHIDLMKDYGIHNITFHYEAHKEDCLGLIKKAKENYPSVGISIKPGTSAKDVPLEIYKEINLLLVMSVEPGFGGQSFIEGTYDKLNDLKEIQKQTQNNFMIQIDGGVKDINAAKLIDAGANNLVAGSYVFNTDESQYKARVESLRS
jgi:ribulose-phosphate 3-epimerase